MIRVSVMYPSTDGASFDLDYWLTKHIPMVSEKCGDALIDMPNYTTIAPIVQISEIKR